MSLVDFILHYCEVTVKRRHGGAKSCCQFNDIVDTEVRVNAIAIKKIGEVLRERKTAALPLNEFV